MDARMESLARYLNKEPMDYQLWVEQFRYSQPDAPVIPIVHTEEGFPSLQGVKQILDSYKPPAGWDYYEVLLCISRTCGVDVLAYLFEFIKATIVAEETHASSGRNTTPNSSRARESRLAQAQASVASEFSRETLLPTEDANKLLLTYLKENPSPQPEGVNMLSIGVDPNKVFSTGCGALRAVCSNKNCPYEVVKCLVDQKHCLLASPQARAAFRDYLESPHSNMDTQVLEIISPLASHVQREETHPAITAVKNPAINANVLRFLFSKYGTVGDGTDLLQDYLGYSDCPSIAAIEMLKNTETDLNLLPQGVNALHVLSCRTLRADLVQWLIKEEKVDAGMPTPKEGRVALHSYLHEAPDLNLEVIQLLADAHGWCSKTDVNKLRFSEEDYEWESALHAAVVNPVCTIQVLNCLLGLGCSVDTPDYNEILPIAVYLEQATNLKLDFIKLLEPQKKKTDKLNLKHYLEGESQSVSSLLHLLADRTDLTAEIVSWCLSDSSRGSTTSPDGNGGTALVRYLQHGNRPEVIILLADGINDTTNALYTLLANYRLNIAACIPPLLLTPPMDADVSLAQYLMDSPAIDLKVINQLQSAHLVDLTMLRESDADSDTEGVSAIVLVLKNVVLSSTELPYIIEWLVANGGCNPDTRDAEGNHPLRIHLDNGQVEPSLQLCQLLLKAHDADDIIPPDDEWAEGGTALDIAVTTNNCPDEVLLYLASRVSNVNHKGKEGITPLCHYLGGTYFDKPPNPEVVRAFITEKTNTEEALSALFNSPYADSWISLPLLQTLITSKTNAKDIRTPDGSPLHSVVTAEKNVPELVVLLVSAGADVTMRDNHGRVPLIAYMQYHVPPDIAVIKQLSSPDIDGNQIFYANLYSDGKLARRGTVQTNTALNVLLLALSSPLHGDLPDDVPLDLIRLFVNGGACACDVNVLAPVLRKCALELYLTSFKLPSANVCLLLSDEGTDRDNVFRRVIQEYQNSNDHEKANHVQNLYAEVSKFPPRAADATAEFADPASNKGGVHAGSAGGGGPQTSPSNQQVAAAAGKMQAGVNPLNHDVSGVLITEQQLHKMFSQLDTNGNGWLSKQEFKAVYRNLDNFGVTESDNQIDTWLAHYNMLGDDRLSYDEFAILMLKVAQR